MIKVEGVETCSIRVKREAYDTVDELTAKNIITSFRSDGEHREEVSKIKYEKISD